MRQLALASTAFLLVLACSSAATASPPSPAPQSPRSSAFAAASPSPQFVLPSTAARIVPGGCGSTHVYTGGVPAWLDVAGDGNNPDSLPYVVGDPPTAAGFIFGYPLRAGHPTDSANKILWVVGFPRDNQNLEITGHPAGAITPSIQDTQTPNSSPGEIYPSIIDVPQAGCWQFDLSWAGHHASLELQYK